MVNEFWVFIVAVLHHWQALLTGGIVALAVLVYEHRSGKSISWRLLLTVMGITLFVSCFLAWHDEYHNSQILESEKSALISNNNALQAKLEVKQEEIERLTSDLAERPTISETANQRAHLGVLRKHLGDFIAQLDGLRKSTCLGGPSPDCFTRWTKLNTRIERYLETDMGSDYVARFKAFEVTNTAPYVGLGEEIVILSDFIKEFH